MFLSNCVVYGKSKSTLIKTQETSRLNSVAVAKKGYNNMNHMDKHF